MLYPNIEECVKAVHGKYALATVVAKRAKELALKAPAELANSHVKEITYALEEIIEGKLTTSHV